DRARCKNCGRVDNCHKPDGTCIPREASASVGQGARELDAILNAALEVSAVDLAERLTISEECRNILARELSRIRSELAEYKEALDDKRTLARELDVAWNGEDGAAKTPALCDIVGQITHELPALRTKERELREALNA